MHINQDVFRSFFNIPDFDTRCRW